MMFLLARASPRSRFALFNFRLADAASRVITQHSCLDLGKTLRRNVTPTAATGDPHTVRITTGRNYTSTFSAITRKTHAQISRPCFTRPLSPFLSLLTNIGNQPKCHEIHTGFGWPSANNCSPELYAKSIFCQLPVRN